MLIKDPEEDDDFEDESRESELLIGKPTNLCAGFMDTERYIVHLSANPGDQPHIRNNLNCPPRGSELGNEDCDLPLAPTDGQIMAV